jgi:hypothetical protein
VPGFGFAGFNRPWGSGLQSAETNDRNDVLGNRKGTDAPIFMTSKPVFG